MHITAHKTGWLIILLILWSGFPAAAAVYHWTDADGVRHYSNTPPPKEAEAIVSQEEIPYDPESDEKRRVQEDAMLQARESAETEQRIEDAEREAEEARREAEAAKRKADQLEKDLEEQDDDRSYGVYYPGHRPPGYRPPGQRPPGQRPPGWRPKPEPYPKPWQQQPRQQPRESSPQGRPRK
jgi:hypothetical protein